MSLLPGSGAEQASSASASVPDAEAIRAAFDEVGDLTIGLEEEVVLVDPASGAPAPRASEVLARVADDTRFKAELPAAQLELLTPPLADAAGAAAVLAAARAALVERAGDLARPIGCGFPPSGPLEGDLNDGERYERILRDYRIVARRQLVCALQVHVAVRGAERALAVYNALRSWLPHVAALAANAPFQGGRDTGMASIRPTVSTMLPRQGVPPALDSWEELAAELRWGASAGCVPEPRRWWWELRPHVAYGTLEVRVPDTQIDSADTAAVAAFVHCLVAWLAARHDAGEALECHPQWRIAENRWSACRDGVEGRFANLSTGASIETRQALSETIDELVPHAAALGCAPELERARAMVDVNGALRQRAYVEELGLAALVGWLADRFAAGG